MDTAMSLVNSQPQRRLQYAALERDAVRRGVSVEEVMAAALTSAPKGTNLRSEYQWRDLTAHLYGADGGAPLYKDDPEELAPGEMPRAAVKSVQWLILVCGIGTRCVRGVRLFGCPAAMCVLRVCVRVRCTSARGPRTTSLTRVSAPGAPDVDVNTRRRRPSLVRARSLAACDTAAMHVDVPAASRGTPSAAPLPGSQPSTVPTCTRPCWVCTTPRRPWCS